MEKRKFLQYPPLEKGTIVSIIIVAIANLILLLFYPGTNEIKTNSDFLSLNDSLLERILIVEGFTFLGYVPLHTSSLMGPLFLISAIAWGKITALWGIFIVYAPLSIPIILTRKEIILKKRIIYAYFSFTQFALLPYLILFFPGL